MGNVCTAGEGQAPTRQAALGAGTDKFKMFRCKQRTVTCLFFSHFSLSMCGNCSPSCFQDCQYQHLVQQ